MRCPNEKCIIEKTKDNYKYCFSCGTELVEKRLNCKQCDCEISKLDMYCPQCGKKLRDIEPWIY